MQVYTTARRIFTAPRPLRRPLIRPLLPHSHSSQSCHSERQLGISLTGQETLLSFSTTAARLWLITVPLQSSAVPLCGVLGLSTLRQREFTAHSAHTRSSSDFSGLKVPSPESYIGSLQKSSQGLPSSPACPFCLLFLQPAWGEGRVRSATSNQIITNLDNNTEIDNRKRICYKIVIQYMMNNG